MILYLFLNLCFISAFGSITTTMMTMPYGKNGTAAAVTYKIYQWSEIRFPENFTLGLSVSNQSFILSPPMTDRKKVVSFVEKYENSVQGIIIVINRIGQLAWSHRKQYYISNKIPMGILLINEMPSLKNGSLSIQFNGWDSNVYSENVPKRVAFFTIELIFILVCFIWCSLKIYNLIKNGEFRLTIGPVCLILEMLNTICRAILTCQRIYFQLGDVYIDSNGEILFLLTLSTAFTVSSGIFIVFFFLNIMKLKIFNAVIMNKAFWPSFILIAITFIAIISLAIWNFITRQEADYISYFIIVLMPILFILAMLYFYTGYRVIIYSQSRTQTEDLISIARKIILSGVCFLLIFILTITSWKRPGPDEQIGQLLISFLLDLVLSVRSFLQIDVFGTIKKKDSVIVEDKTGSRQKNTASSTA